MSQLKKFVPPILVDLKKRVISPDFGWFGDYKNWQEATDLSSGYDSAQILEKVISATQAVLRGEAEFERDSVLFHKKDYPFHITTALLWVASQNYLRLNVLDFGGALGSTYYQNRLFLQNLNVVWSIVEQSNFVNAGKQHFEDERLKFFHTIQESIAQKSPDLILLSSVLPYIPDPYGLLEEIFSYDISYLILDKHPLIKGNSDRLTIQKVPPSIYKASYPAWFFSEAKFYKYLASKYELVYDHNCDIQNNVQAKFTGIVARLK